MIVIVIQIFWSRLNDFSFLTINTLISMTVPGIVQIFSKVLYNLIFKDILQTDKWLLPEGINNGDEKYLNSFFYESGFTSMKIMTNLGSTLAYLVFYIAIWVQIFILYLFRSIKCAENILRKEIEIIKYWTMILFQSQFCPLITSSIINLYDLSFSSKLDTLQSILSIIFPPLLFGMLIIQAFLIRNASLKGCETLKYQRYLIED